MIGHVYSVIYQISDIGTDDQISEVGIRSIIYQTRYFALNILRDNYVIITRSTSFRALRLKPRCERAATL